MSRATKQRTDNQIDKMVAAYIAEASRWGWRRINKPFGQRDRFVLYWIDEAGHESIIKLTARECRDSKEAEMWLNTYCSRAGMRAALTTIL